MLNFENKVKCIIGLKKALCFSHNAALASSTATIYTIFTSFAKLPAGNSVFSVAALSEVALVIFVMVEILYISLAVRAICREIRQIGGK